MLAKEINPKKEENTLVHGNDCEGVQIGQK